MEVAMYCSHSKKLVTKTSNSGYSNSHNGGKNYGKNTLYNTTDKVWMPSVTEVGGDGEISSSYCAYNQGKKYEYYTGASSRSFTPLKVNTWVGTRSMHVQYATQSCTIKQDGSFLATALGDNTYKAYARIFGFCI